MRSIEISLPLKRLARMLASFSVRTRIVVLALIPVAGFVANGLTFTAGEVGRAFGTLAHSTALTPDGLVVSYEQAHALALKALDTLAASIDRNHTENIVGLRKDVTALRQNFNELVQEEKTLGFDDSSGLRKNLQVAGNAVERIINENMSGLAEADATRLLVALLSMRHFEADYRVNQSEVSRQQFVMAYRKIADLFNGITVTPALKQTLEQQVKTYSDTFEKWVEAYDRVRPLRSIIDIDNQNMLPRADEIVRYARSTANEASERLAVSQSRTRTGIIAVGIAMVALGLGFSWLIGRSITRPLNEFATVMKRLADGDTTTRIPATLARDEIGEMARRVMVFRDNMNRAGATGSDANRNKPRARTAQRRDRIDNLAIQKLGGNRTEQAARSINEAGDKFGRAQQSRGHSVVGSRKRQRTRGCRIRERHRGRQFGRGIGGLHCRDCFAGGEINRGSGSGSFRSSAYRHDNDGAGKRGYAYRGGCRAHPGYRRTNQSARAQRNHRSGARGRIWQRVCRCCGGSEIPG